MLHKDDVAQTLTDMETLERIHHKPTIFIADPDCPYCHGTGIRCIPCGPDDYDREVCDCQPEADNHD